MPNFIDLKDLNSEDLEKILLTAKQLKSKDQNSLKLKNKQLAMIFEKPSTRTRVSFEVGINQLGGNAIVIDSSQSQISRGEPIADTGNVLSRFVDLIMIRSNSHKTILELAKHSTKPVINGLSDFSHPCQVMADILTFEEHLGYIQDKTITWIGDGNNVVNSWIHAAEILGFKLNISTPKELKPKEFKKSKNIEWFKDPKDAAKNSNMITTDTWVSMGDEDYDRRINLLKPFQVNKEIMSLAKKSAIFMHCLPAHREEEVTSEVIDGKQSVIYDEAENRLHIQKAIMLWCMGQ